MAPAGTGFHHILPTIQPNIYIYTVYVSKSRDNGYLKLHTLLHAIQFCDKEFQSLNTLLLKTNLLISSLALLKIFWNDLFVHFGQTQKIFHFVIVDNSNDH